MGVGGGVREAQNTDYLTAALDCQRVPSSVVDPNVAFRQNHQRNRLMIGDKPELFVAHANR